MDIKHISKVNLERCLVWHPEGLESWSLSDWGVALGGEVGELLNVVKKLNRVRDDLVGNKVAPWRLEQAMADEIADVYLYLDLFAQAAGVDLSEAVAAKFNETSQRLSMPQRL